MVTSKEIRDWMDNQIEAKRLQSLRVIVEEHDDGVDDYLSNLSACDYIHIGAEAIRYIADRLDITIYVTARKRDSDNPYELALFYKGEKFIGLETEAEYTERGAVV